MRDVPIQAVTHEKLYVAAVRQLQTLVENGEFKEGHKLPPERTLAEMLGISRPSVRQALCALEALGLVEIRPGAGTFVSNQELPMRQYLLTERSNPLEVLEVRLMLEPEAVALACSRRTSSDLQDIEACLKSPLESNAYSDEHQFHVALIKACHNSTLNDTAKVLAQQMGEVPWLAVKDQTERSAMLSQQVLREHTEIFEAVKSRHAAQARQATHRHLVEMRRRIMDVAKNQ